MKMNLINKSCYFVLLCLFCSLQLTAQTLKRVVVAQDGSGDYKTVQAAFNAAAAGNKKKVVIFIKNGVYKEKLLLDKSKKWISVVGEDKFNTILTYDDHASKAAANGDTINTRTS